MLSQPLLSSPPFPFFLQLLPDVKMFTDPRPQMWNMKILNYKQTKKVKTYKTAFARCDNVHRPTPKTLATPVSPHGQNSKYKKTNTNASQKHKSQITNTNHKHISQTQITNTNHKQKHKKNTHNKSTVPFCVLQMALFDNNWQIKMEGTFTWSIMALR